MQNQLAALRADVARLTIELAILREARARTNCGECYSSECKMDKALREFTNLGPVIEEATP
jgi:hypothetical protein